LTICRERTQTAKRKPYGWRKGSAVAQRQVDVLIVGAGVSGLNVAYRLQERCPELSYRIVEGRGRLGGTWDLFRYPGVRSDSDIYTLAFPFQPWRGANSIVDGEEIWAYLDATARDHALDEHIDFGTRVRSANWSSADARWHVEADCAGEPVTYVARFVAFCTGYYDYAHPYDPGFVGVADYEGTLVHPQFWPADLDYDDKRVLVIGSGATAVTIVPAMAPRAAHVTMLQRTPTYVLAQPRTDGLADALRRVLPLRIAHQIIRAKNTAVGWAFYRACRRWPGAMRRLLRAGAARALGSQRLADEYFRPPYEPWDQRLCLIPQGDLFREIRHGSVSVVTGAIDRFVGKGVRLTTGEVLEADLVVTATGLSIQLLGGVEVTLDDAPVDVSRCYTYYGAMLSGLPNLGVCIGYINLSWTMRSDLTARLLARVLRRLVDTGADVVMPVAPPDLGPAGPFMQMQSGYLRRAADRMPRATRRYPWAMRQNVVVDAWATNRADLDNGLQWTALPLGIDGDLAHQQTHPRVGVAREPGASGALVDVADDHIHAVQRRVVRGAPHHHRLAEDHHGDSAERTD
jgi:cation diffusion facilitator CzcD-associated flavoprotein CzcO